MDHYHYSKPLNFMQWVRDNDELFRPPVGNQQIWSDSDFMVTVVGGPNQRSDFHDNPTEEFFYQFKGNASLIVLDRGQYDRVELKEGDVYLQPPHVLHSPQRPDPESRCIVIERQRPTGEKDGLQWSCANCAHTIARYEQEITNIVTQLPPVYKKFYATSEADRTCPDCGEVHPADDWQAWHATLNRVHNV